MLWTSLLKGSLLTGLDSLIQARNKGKTDYIWTSCRSKWYAQWVTSVVLYSLSFETTLGIYQPRNLIISMSFSGEIWQLTVYTVRSVPGNTPTGNLETLLSLHFVLHRRRFQFLGLMKTEKLFFSVQHFAFYWSSEWWKVGCGCSARHKPSS